IKTDVGERDRCRANGVALLSLRFGLGHSGLLTMALGVVEQRLFARRALSRLGEPLILVGQGVLDFRDVLEIGLLGHAPLLRTDDWSVLRIDDYGRFAVVSPSLTACARRRVSLGETPETDAARACFLCKSRVADTVGRLRSADAETTQLK